jgi:hypothetical protein
MTKKDYIRAAEIIRAAEMTKHERALMVSAFCELFRGDNPRFDDARFIAACDPINPTIQARKSTKPRPARTGFDS